MATYIYSGKSFDSINHFNLYLKKEDLKASFSYAMGGDLIVESDELEADITNAVDSSVSGTLWANKQNKITDVQIRSSELISEGVETWEIGKFAECTESAVDRYIAAYTYFTDFGVNPIFIQPYGIVTLDKELITTTSAVDLKFFIDACAFRLTYVYTSVGSEMDLTNQILSAPDQTTLDSIIDTRS